MSLHDTPIRDPTHGTKYSLSLVREVFWSDLKRRFKLTMRMKLKIKLFWFRFEQFILFGPTTSFMSLTHVRFYKNLPDTKSCSVNSFSYTMQWRIQEISIDSLALNNFHQENLCQ